MAARSKRPPFVEVTWDDAHSVAEWICPQSLPPIAVCISRGWMIYEDKRQVTLVSTYQGDAEMHTLGEAITIPRGCVTSIRRLKIG